jgi:acyl dehydratase
LAVLRAIDPDLDLPPLGPAVNGGNSYRWLAPVYPGDRLRRQTAVAEVRTRQGRTGRLVFLTTQMTVLRGDELVAVSRATNIYR